jgi:histidine triad (HIT) family protein
MNRQSQIDNRQSPPCVFCAIAAGDVPSYEVYGDEEIYAFLDIHPIRPAHMQVIPREHYSYFDDLPPELAARILHLAQRIAPILKDMFDAPRVGFAFTGGDVPHAHAHVVPLFTNYDITSRSYIVEDEVTFRPPPTPPLEDLAQTAARLREALRSHDP